MEKRILPALVLVVLLLLAGCGARKDAASGLGAGEGGYEVPRDESGAAPGEPVSGDGAKSGGAAGPDQKLIYSASMVLETEDLTAATAEVTSIARQAGGFVASSNLYVTEKRRAADFLLRVPAERLSVVLDQIRTLGNVRRESLDSENVTLQYIDLEARIRNLQRQEERLLDILDQAATVEDILRVEQELSRIRGDLEARTAEFRYLRDRVDFASVFVSLEETYAANASVNAGGLKGVWRRAFNALILSVNSMVTGLGEFIVLVFRILPYLLLLLALGKTAFWLKRKFHHPRKDS